MYALDREEYKYRFVEIVFKIEANINIDYCVLVFNRLLGVKVTFPVYITEVGHRTRSHRYRAMYATDRRSAAARSPLSLSCWSI